jgi:hypothetical protein
MPAPSPVDPAQLGAIHRDSVAGIGTDETYIELMPEASRRRQRGPTISSRVAHSAVVEGKGPHSYFEASAFLTSKDCGSAGGAWSN